MRFNSTKTVNEVLPSYTHYLEPKLGKLYFQMASSSVPLENMKKNIRNYVYPARYSYSKDGQVYYTKKKWFLDKIDNMNTKSQLYMFCRNSVRKAKETLVSSGTKVKS